MIATLYTLSCGQCQSCSKCEPGSPPPSYSPQAAGVHRAFSSAAAFLLSHFTMKDLLVPGSFHLSSKKKQVYCCLDKIPLKFSWRCILLR